MKTKFEAAEEVFFSGEYLRAFDMFRKITKGDSSFEEKSDAYLMMGATVLIDTHVEHEDESGLEYFIASLNLNPFNIGTIWNIIDGFGTSINNHQNIEILNQAIGNLKEVRNNQLTEEDIMLINKKKQIEQVMLGT